METDVKNLNDIREKLKKGCDVQAHKSEKQVKAGEKKYAYSAPFNRNVIHYISG